MQALQYAAIQVGDTAELTKAFTDKDVRQFAELSEDRNPVHLDETYAQGTIFKHRIVHGVLTTGLISAVLATKLPGPGAIYLSQTLNFKAPVYLDEAITARVEVLEKRDDKKILTFKTTCSRADGGVVLEGQAVIKLLQ